jgi:hypothetical protein
VEINPQLVESSELSARFFSLKRDNDAITIEHGFVLEDLQTIVTLDEEFREQSAYYAKKAKKE